jgi:hypothetical protein
MDVKSCIGEPDDCAVELRKQLEALLNSLGSTDVDIAATLASAGVKGDPGSSTDGAMARYLNAVVAFDPRVAAISVMSSRIAVTCGHCWLRVVIIPTPSSMSSFLVRFDRGDFPDLLASPVDPWPILGSDSE